MKKKILHVYPKLNIGGTEKVIESIIKTLQNKYEFWILTEEKGNMEEAFLSLNTKIKRIKKEKNYWKEVKDFFSKETFDIIHVHNYKDMGAMLKIAKKCHIKTRIIHSHVGRNESFLYNFLKRIKSYHVIIYATHYLACSSLAAKWLFQKKYQESIILKNGIDPKLFKYNEQIRNSIKEKYALDEKTFVIGTVARMSKEKNQIFLLHVLKKIQKEKQNVQLIFVGDGPLMEEIKEKTKELGLKDNVIFTGNVKDPEIYYSSFDLFVLPSLYEGLPLSLVEAQYNGLTSFCSNTISKEVDILENLLFTIPLDIDLWKNKIIDYINHQKTRPKITSKKFDMKENIKILERIYDEEK